MSEQAVLSEELKRIEAIALEARQNQFAALLGIDDPEQLRHLQFCGDCGGQDYQWTDWATSELPMLGFIKNHQDALDYRTYLAETACKSCDATGFEAGSFELSIEQWLKLGKPSDDGSV